MKRSMITTASMGFWAFLLLTCYHNSYAQAPTKLESQKDRLSYTIGVDLGRNFSRQGIAVNYDVFLQGLKDAAQKRKLLLSNEQMKGSMQQFQKDLMARRTRQFNKRSDKNLKTGQKFLADNKAKKGVIALSSGLQYRVLKRGTGSKPNAKDTVKVTYTGRLINGQVFDSTDKTGKPATFRVDRVIKGWTEALQLMSEGATWEVYVPAYLAYGSRGIGGPIGPNETLIFKIHLISVEKKAASTASKSAS